MADLTFSSILSKYASGSGAPASAPASSMPTSRSLPASSSTSRPSASQPPPKSRITAVGQSRPSASGNTNGTAIRSASMGNINAAGSRPNDRTNGASLKNDNGATAAKKRKLDNPSENLPLTETDKERAERKRILQEKLKLKKEKEAGGLSGPASSAPTSKPAPVTGSARLSASAAPKTSASAPNTSSGSLTKLSYKELLARAAKLQEEKKMPGGITHKARAPVTEKKEWQKKLEARQQQAAAGGSVADRKSKSPGAISGGERSTLAKKAAAKDMGKAAPVKKAGSTTERGRTSVVKGKASDKSKPVEPPVKRKRSPSPISWRGRNAATTTKKPSRPRPGRSRYDEDDEEDDWIVDDDEDDGGGYSRRYRYAESDEYDSGSDMEAAGLDILEEEERSRRNAIKEDLEQEKLEKELAARKAAMKKKGKK